MSDEFPDSVQPPFDVSGSVEVEYRERVDDLETLDHAATQAAKAGRKQLEEHLEYKIRDAFRAMADGLPEEVTTEIDVSIEQVDDE